MHFFSCKMNAMYLCTFHPPHPTDLHFGSFSTNFYNFCSFQSICRDADGSVPQITLPWCIISPWTTHFASLYSTCEFAVEFHSMENFLALSSYSWHFLLDSAFRVCVSLPLTPWHIVVICLFGATFCFSRFWTDTNITCILFLYFSNILYLIGINKLLLIKWINVIKFFFHFSFELDNNGSIVINSQ